MKKFLIPGLILLLGAMMAGCGNSTYVVPDEPVYSGTPEPFNTDKLQPTVVILNTPTATPTPTATFTPTPTATDTPTPTPSKAIIINGEPLPTLAPKYSIVDRKSADIPFIMIDPGHGGKEAPGACQWADGVEIEEADINLAISLKLAQKLEAMGIQVVMTRDDDSFVENKQRKAMSNLSDIDLFISIHQNSVDGNPNRKGIELYRTKKFETTSGDFAFALRDVIEKNMGYTPAIGGDSGSDPAKNLIVLQTYRPAVLVECGYMTCPAEFERIRSEAYQDELVDTLIDGIVLFLTRMNKYEGFLPEPVIKD